MTTHLARVTRIRFSFFLSGSSSSRVISIHFSVSVPGEDVGVTLMDNQTADVFAGGHATG